MEAGRSEWAEEAERLELCDAMEIPLLGVVAAGVPYQAFSLRETVSVPAALWGGKPVFALRVRGSSMIDEGIHNGDYLIVEPRQTADNGQTVVAEIDGCVTVKKFHRDTGGQIRLQPSHPEMLPLLVRVEDVRIIGVVVGVLRKFGFGERRSRTAITGGTAPPPPLAPARRPPVAARDAASIDLAVNAIDSQLVRWNAAMAHAKRDRRLRQHVVQMAELGRDLQALRDWCARTDKPGLRRALIAEANTVMRRMQRFAAVTPAHLPDLIIH